METQGKIVGNYEQSLKAKNMAVVETLRLVIAAFKNKEIEKRGKTGTGELTEEEAIEVVTREVKKRREAIELYEKGGRADLAEKELAELKIIEIYLPPQMGEEEIKDVVKKKVDELGNPPASDFGKVMGVVMKDLKGKADAQLVTNILKGLLK